MINRRTSPTRSVEPNIWDSRNRERPTPLVFEELNFFPQLCCSSRKRGKANPSCSEESDFFPNFPKFRTPCHWPAIKFPTPSFLPSRRRRQGKNELIGKGREQVLLYLYFRIHYNVIYGRAYGSLTIPQDDILI